MAGLFFLLDAALIGAAWLLAVAGVFRSGGARRDGPGRLAAGLYALAAGLALSIVPALRWPIAATDNAFLGQWMLTVLTLVIGAILAVLGWVDLRADRRRPAVAGLALALAGVGTALAVAVLLLRGPEPWQTRPTATFGSGTFGFDVVAAGVAIGAAVFFLGRELARRGDATA